MWKPEGFGSPRITKGCKKSYGYWELNQSPLEGQPVLLTPEPSLWSSTWLFWDRILWCSSSWPETFSLDRADLNVSHQGWQEVPLLAEPLIGSRWPLVHFNLEIVWVPDHKMTGIFSPANGVDGDGEVSRCERNTSEESSQEHASFLGLRNPHLLS